MTDKNYLFKVLVVGEYETGKTSIIKRYVHRYFSYHYRTTIGVDFALKVLHFDDDTSVKLQLWDIAGQERFGNMTRSYYKEASGAFIVYDVTRFNTLEAAIKWKKDLDSKVTLPNGDSIPSILLGNKSDCARTHQLVDENYLDQFISENGFIGRSFTSAKEDFGIDESVNNLIEIVNNILSHFHMT